MSPSDNQPVITPDLADPEGCATSGAWDDAEGALREAMTDVLAIAQVPDEDAPVALMESLRNLGWVLVPTFEIPGSPGTVQRLAAQWHNASDHATDGEPFGGPYCNCLRVATRATELGWGTDTHAPITK